MTQRSPMIQYYERLANVLRAEQASQKGPMTDTERSLIDEGYQLVESRPHDADPSLLMSAMLLFLVSDTHKMTAWDRTTLSMGSVIICFYFYRAWRYRRWSRTLKAWESRIDAWESSSHQTRRST
jgi:hypothetical protein